MAKLYKVNEIVDAQIFLPGNESFALELKKYLTEELWYDPTQLTLNKVKELILAGAYVDTQNLEFENNTALIAIMRHGDLENKKHIDFVNFLICKGADPKIRNNTHGNPESAIYWAEMLEKKELLKCNNKAKSLSPTSFWSEKA